MPRAQFMNYCTLRKHQVAVVAQCVAQNYILDQRYFSMAPTAKRYKNYKHIENKKDFLASIEHLEKEEQETKVCSMF